MKFTWDRRKNRANLEKHGVFFDEATTVFADPLAASIPDPDHSEGEERFVTMGYSARNRLIVVCHTEEGDTVRIISAREANSHERKKYES
jgi:uncharacterized DUF497 family protein